MNAHVVCDLLRQDSVKSKPDESLDALVDGKQRGKRCEEQLTAVPHARQRYHAEGG
jgi:hypothetical protein